MIPNTTYNKKKQTTIAKIDKVSNITQLELIKNYIEPSIPVIVKDATKDWKAVGKFTPDFFKKNYRHITKTIKGKTYSISEYIDLMLASTPENPAPYPFNFNIEKQAPELLADITPEILYAKSDRVKHPLLPKFMLNGTEVYEIFLGGNGGSFPFLHVDVLFLHTQITQLYGSKDFFLFSPDQTPYMYPREDNAKVSQVDVFNPDYEKFPLFKNANPIKVTVEEGETILFPTKWWHTTQIHEPCISLGRVHLNAANWNDFANDNFLSLQTYRPAVARPALLYAKMLGKLMNLQERIGL
jgi:hypothetical protein